MQTKHLCVLFHIGTKGEVGAPLNRFNPQVKYTAQNIQRNTVCFDIDHNTNALIV